MDKFMLKSIRNCFDKRLTFEKLIEAEKRAGKNKGNNKEVIKYRTDLESNIVNLLMELKSGTYRLGKYREFKIFEPKERLIKCLPYKDRIAQQWYIEEFIKPYYVPRMIKDSYACIEKRGTIKAVNQLQKYMNKYKKEFPNYYVLQCDIRKFFFNIDKNILFNILKRNIKDKKLLELTYLFIFDNQETKSIPIGNYTSQYFGNIYLNELDKYVKNILKIKYYVRYLDDFIILGKDKEECKYLKDKIELFLKQNLLLEYNPKSRYYPSSLGIDFCGYRIFEDYCLIRNRCKKNILKKIKLWKKLRINNKLDLRLVKQSWNSYLGHIKHVSSYNFQLKIKLYLEDLFYID